MVKQGGKIRTWHRRWFQLDSSKKELSYFKAPPDVELKGVIDLSISDSIEIAPECRKQPAFKIVFKERTYYFVPDTMEEARSWVQIIKDVNGGRIFPENCKKSDFTIVETIAEKNNCLIQLATYQSNNDHFILKIYKRSILNTLYSNNFTQILEQKKIFLHLVSPFVTSLYAIIEDEYDIILVYEYVSTGCLFGHLWNDEMKFSETTVQLYAAEILLALDFLHSHDIVYGKLCPDSILLCQDGHIKLSDPGFSHLFFKSEPITSYDAPELINKNDSSNDNIYDSNIDSNFLSNYSTNNSNNIYLSNLSITDNNENIPNNLDIQIHDINIENNDSLNSNNNINDNINSINLNSTNCSSFNSSSFNSSSFNSSSFNSSSFNSSGFNSSNLNSSNLNINSSNLYINSSNLNINSSNITKTKDTYNSGLTIAQDWYSFGALVYEMICGMPPFWEDDPLLLKKVIKSNKLLFPHHISSQAKDLIKALMNHNPRKRLGNSIEDIKQHPFFQGVDWITVAEHSFEPEILKSSKNIYSNLLQSDQ